MQHREGSPVIRNTPGNSARRRSLSCHANRTFPDFVPSQQAQEVVESAALDMLSNYRSTEVPVPGYPGTARTAFVGPRLTGTPAPSLPDGTSPVVLLHGFDSSAVEFRRLYPLLSKHVDTYALDVLGSGFTDTSAFAQDPSLPLGPKQIREHLFNFWRQEIGKPMVLVGASLGGTMGLDFALEYPMAVEKLVLLDAQGYIDGIGPVAKGPRFMARFGAYVLRSYALRETASKMSYHDTERYATRDATIISQLHTLCDGWVDAKVAFIRSGGYQGINTRLGEVRQPTLVLWGAQDKILDPKYAKQFEADLPDAQLLMIDKCGHVPHLEQSQACADAILSFCCVTAVEQQLLADSA